jgi:protein ImuB
MRNRGVGDARAAVASTPVAAELAVLHGAVGEGGVVVVAPGTDCAYTALFPVAALDPPPRLTPLLAALGITTCGELAALSAESVEVRLGADGLALWRLARADDPRLIFSPAPRDVPHASLDWTDYALKDPARLLFSINALLTRVCGELIADGRGAHELALTFSLTSRGTHVELLRASRPTANQRTWVRLARTVLERLRLHEAVTGVALHASRLAAREAPQGDLFDRGFTTTGAAEDAVARIIEDQGEQAVVTPENSVHPLLDVRTTWAPRVASLDARVPALPVRSVPPGVSEAPPAYAAGIALTLQLAPVPRAITVATAPRRDHFVPVRYRDGRDWHEIVQAAGPDRVSGGTWDPKSLHAREYFRCVTRGGVLVWLFRDAQAGAWYLHGWWD